MNMSLLLSSEQKPGLSCVHPEADSDRGKHVKHQNPSNLLHLLSSSPEIHVNPHKHCQISDQFLLASLTQPPTTTIPQTVPTHSVPTPSHMIQRRKTSIPDMLTGAARFESRNEHVGSLVIASCFDNNQIQDTELRQFIDTDHQDMPSMALGDTPSTALSSAASSATSPSTPSSRIPKESPHLFRSLASRDNFRINTLQHLSREAFNCARSQTCSPSRNEGGEHFFLDHHKFLNVHGHEYQGDREIGRLPSVSNDQFKVLPSKSSYFEGSEMRAKHVSPAGILSVDGCSKVMPHHQVGAGSAMGVDDDRDARLEKAVSMVLSRRFSVRKAAQAFRLPKSTVHRYLQATRGPASIVGVCKPLRRFDHHSLTFVAKRKPRKCDISFLVDNRYD